MWLHMGSFGPKRVALRDAQHTLSPYSIVDNAYSLLDVTDLVFIDAPGTGFSRVWGPGKEKAFYGLDADAHAFAEFINTFLSRYSRWKSPKYLFGESYGTTRSAVLADVLQSDYGVDLTGVILLSQVLNFDLNPERVRYNPGTDQAYITALPSYAAVAWYHHRLPDPRPADLAAFLRKVEQFALTDYAVALRAGSVLDADRRTRIAKRIAAFIGLPESYILQSDLRIDASQFRKMLLDTQGRTVGMTDGRFAGPSLDPLSRGADYLPELSAITGAFTGAINYHLRVTLGYGGETPYANNDLDPLWDWKRDQPAHAPTQIFGVINVLPDLARAMKYNPDLKVMVNGGYFDLGTPYFESKYEMHHLPIPQILQRNIEYHYYPAGHMVYLHEPALRELRDNVVAFIRRTGGQK